MTEDEIGNLKTIGKSLNENLGLTQLSLINYCDAYEKNLMRRLKHPNATDEHAKAIGEMVESNNKLQAQFLDLKSSIKIMLDSALSRLE
jgi:hypothetical protein